jgi:hypothetical protein
MIRHCERLSLLKQSKLPKYYYRSDFSGFFRVFGIASGILETRNDGKSLSFELPIWLLGFEFICDYYFEFFRKVCTCR